MLLLQYTNILTKCTRARYFPINYFHTSRIKYNTNENDNLPVIDGRKSVKLKTYQLPEKKNMNLVKDLFVGKMNQELMIYPEIESNDQVLHLTKYLEPIIDYFCDVETSTIEHSGEIGKEHYNTIKQYGVMGSEMLEKYGGLEMSALEACRLSEVVGQDQSIVAALSTHQKIAIHSILSHGSEAQKEKYLPLLASGEMIATLCSSEFGESKTMLDFSEITDEDDTRYILNGKKNCVVNAKDADLFVVTAKHAGSTKSKRDSQTALYLVEKDFPGVSVTQASETIGVKALQISDVTFLDTPIPFENKMSANVNDVLMDLNVHRYHTTAVTHTSMLKTILGDVVEHVLTEEEFDVNLMDFSVLQEKLANIQTGIYTMESAAYYLAGLYDKCHSENLTVEAAILKAYCTETAVECVNLCTEVLGKKSYQKNHICDQLLRDLRFHQFYESNNHILKMHIGTNCLHYAGQEKLQLLKKFRDPYNNPSSVYKKIFDAFSYKYDEPKLTIQLYDHVHPNLAFDAEAIEKRVHQLSSIAEHYCATFGNDLINEQMALNHFATVAIKLFTCVSCMSRATRSIAIGLRNCDDEILMAHLVVLKTIRDVDESLQHLKEFKDQNGDELKKRVCKSMLKSKGYSPKHPLTRNW